MEKKCPLLFAIERYRMVTQQDTKLTTSTNCIGEECAWFIRHEKPNVKGLDEECAIQKLSNDTMEIKLRIYDLLSKK